MTGHWGKDAVRTDEHCNVGVMPAHSFFLSVSCLDLPRGLSGGEAKSGGAKVCSRYSASRARSSSHSPIPFCIPPPRKSRVSFRVHQLYCSNHFCTLELRHFKVRIKLYATCKKQSPILELLAQCCLSVSKKVP